VVDDDPHLVTLFVRMAEHLGYPAEGTTDPREALGWLEMRPSRFGVLLTDNNMPHMPGVKLTRRALAARPGLAVVLMTGSDVEGLSEELDGAFAAVAQKPLLLKDFAVVLEKATDRGRGQG
jgi:DNA-binding NtrC family response regulator